MNFKILRSFLGRYLPDPFIIGLFLMILFAYVYPRPGVADYPINLGHVIDYGISFIFFFYGLKLSPQRFQAGLKNWKLHITIQSITFLIFPLLVLAFYPLMAGGNYETLWLAVFFLAVLPSTVSSSVVMVSIARGNIPGAIFNASISGLIGIFLTPLWMGIFLESRSEEFAFSEVILQLLLQILLPVVAGLLLNSYLGKWAEKYKKRLSIFDQLVILLIVYKSFSHTFAAGLLQSIGGWPLFFLSLSVVVLFFLIIFISRRIATFLNFVREDHITAVFCGTKKSLVHGSVMYSVLFTGFAAGGLMLLPIMIYHAFQLFYISILAKKLSKEVPTAS